MSFRIAWAALAAAAVTVAAPASDFDVVLSEIHYHPFGEGDSALEFVELHNAGTSPVDLGGWTFHEGIHFAFPPATWIEPGSYLAVSPDAELLRSLHRAARILGDYQGRLDNAGEVVALADDMGRPVARVHYGDGGEWSSPADGLGPSLELLLPRGDIDRPQVWKSSRRMDGTPGAPNTRGRGDFPFTGKDDLPAVRLNEVKPQWGAADPGFIEVFNGGAARAELGGFQLLNSIGQAHPIAPGTGLAPGGFLLLDARQIGFPPAAGATYALLGADGLTIADALDVRVTRSGFSCQRFPDGDADSFVAPATPGAANAYTADDRVIVNEVFFAPVYEPPFASCLRDCSDRHQWIELHNRSGSPVDLTGWSLDKAVTHVFPSGTSLPAGGFLIVAASEAVFRAGHPGVPLAPGSWAGSLGRRSDAIVLRDSLGNRAGRVEYGNGNPFNDVEPPNDRDDGTLIASDWPSGVADSGRSLELLNPALENAAGRSWRLGPSGGTPGRANSVLDADPAPVVARVVHSPAVPTSADRVTVTCRVHGAGPLSAVDVLWRIDGQAGATRAPMADDGNSGDGLAGDSVHGALLPPQPRGTVVAFQIEVASASGKSATYPLRAPAAPRTPYYLYEVDDQPPLANGSVDYRVIMSSADRATLQQRPLESEVLLHATFIGDGEAHHLAAIRYRGENTRGLPRKSYRIEFPPEARFQGMEILNLNAANGGQLASSVNDFLVSDLFRRAGSPYIQEWPVNLHFRGGVEGDSQGRGDVDPHYIRKEHFNRDFLARFFGGSDRGNLYRPIDPRSGVGTGDLSYRGEDPDSYAQVYEKRSNRDENDYSDLIELIRAFDSNLTPAADFPGEMRRLIDVKEWALFFAIQDFVTNNDGGIQTNSGEDYYLYHVPEDSARPDAGLWLIIPWDIEETFTDDNDGLFLTQVAASRRFIRHPEFAPLYLASLQGLRAEHASRRAMRGPLEYVTDIFPAAAAQSLLNAYDVYVTRRLALLGAQIIDRIRAGVPASTVPGTRLIAEGDSWSYFKGTEEPAAEALAWTEVDFDDASWPQGPSGFGYGDGDDATAFDDMREGGGDPGYPTLYIRRQFDVPDPARITGLTLIVDYDDAFVAYVNGIEVARSAGLAGIGEPGEPIPFDVVLGNSVNHEASRGNNNPNPPESFPIAGVAGLLAAGPNVLAIQGFNSTLDSSDFSLIPELIAQAAASAGAGGWGDRVFASGPSVTLEGSADASTTGSLRAGGVLAAITRRPPAGGPPYGLSWRVDLPVAPGPRVFLIEAFSDASGTGRLVELARITVHGLAGGFRRLSGRLPGSQVWAADDGPHVIDSRVVVPAGATLVIEPGAQVLLRGQATIAVEGILDARGTAARPIVLRPFEVGARWGGIHLDGTGTGAGAPVHRLSHVDIELGGSASGQSGCIFVEGAAAVLDSCSIRDTAAAAVEAVNARLEVKECAFEDVAGGVRATRSAVTMADSFLSGMTGSADAVSLDGNAGEPARIERCTIERCPDDGIVASASTIEISGCTLRFIADRACSISGAGPLGPSAAGGNLIHDCGIGIEVQGGGRAAEGRHDTIVSTRTAFLIRGAGTEAAFHSVIAWRNETSAEVEASAAFDLTWSDMGGALEGPADDEVAWPGAGNVLADPRFIDMPARNFGLGAGSPCRGSGLGGADMGITGFAADTAFIRGDATGDGAVNLTDGIVVLDYLFRSGSPPRCADAADTDDNGQLNLSDAIYLLNHLFRSGRAPAPPYPQPGRDAGGDGLGCG